MLNLSIANLNNAKNVYSQVTQITLYREGKRDTELQVVAAAECLNHVYANLPEGIREFDLDEMLFKSKAFSVGEESNEDLPWVKNPDKRYAKSKPQTANISFAKKMEKIRLCMVKKLMEIRNEERFKNLLNYKITWGDVHRTPKAVERMGGVIASLLAGNLKNRSIMFTKGFSRVIDVPVGAMAIYNSNVIVMAMWNKVKKYFEPTGTEGRWKLSRSGTAELIRAEFANPTVVIGSGKSVFELLESPIVTDLETFLNWGNHSNIAYLYQSAYFRNPNISEVERGMAQDAMLYWAQKIINAKATVFGGSPREATWELIEDFSYWRDIAECVRLAKAAVANLLYPKKGIGFRPPYVGTRNKPATSTASSTMPDIFVDL
jgi:hypothetical protein